MDIRDDISINDTGSGWHVEGFKPTEDRTFTDKDQAEDYAKALAGRHFLGVVWLPVNYNEIISH